MRWTRRSVRLHLVAEALFIAALSWLAAVLLALPLTAWVGRTVGMLSFRAPLPLAMKPPALGSWLVLVALVGVAAAIVPAHGAANLTVREGLGRI